MLNILQLIPTLDRSGAEKQMVILAKGLPRDRFRVQAAALTRLGPLQADLEAAGIPVALIGKRLKLDPLALARLVRFLKSGRFDVVQTWIFAANTYGRVAARLARVPIVITTEHGARTVPDGVRVIVAGTDRIELAVAIDALAASGLRRIHCEGGPALLAALAAGGLLDEHCLTIAPLMLGSGAAPVLPMELSDPLAWHLLTATVSGSHLFTRYRKTAR